MLEGFKINCYPLNRSIRINIHLPKDYNETGRFYPVIYFFDGQNVFNENDSFSSKSLELEKTIEKLKDDNKEAIYITIASASNPDKRLEEYKEKNYIKDYICGGDLDIFNPKYQNFKYLSLIPNECKKFAIMVLYI